MRKKTAIILTLILLFSTLFSPSLVRAETPPGFVETNGSAFTLNGTDYKAVGVCIYLAQEANYEYITRVIGEAKKNGITLIRAVDIFSSVYGKSDGFLYSDSVWKRMDWIFKTASDQGMKVLLDLSSLRQFLYESPVRRDSYDPASDVIWDGLIDFMTARVNSFTGIVYKEDPVIMSYAISGEPVCYGGDLGSWPNGIHSSRNADDIERSIFHVADRLRQKDSNHLISAGGLLHMSPTDGTGNPFYKTVWSYPSIDYSSIHIYPPEGDPVGEWTNLAVYKNYSDSIGKPLMMEEFGHGGTDMTDKKAYLQDGLERCLNNQIPVVILWNWSLGQGFDLFPHQTEIMELLHTYANLYGFVGEFEPLSFPKIDGIPFKTFETGVENFSPLTGDPGYGGPVSSTSQLASEGQKSLLVPVKFAQKYQWYWMNAGIAVPLNLSGADYIAADVYLPADATPMYMKFSLNGIEQAESGRLNNWLIPGQWNTVYASLRNPAVCPEGSDWIGGALPSFENVTSLWILITNMNTAYTGNLYIDNIRVGQMVDPEPEPEPPLTIESLDVRIANGKYIFTCRTSGGKGTVFYAYCLYKRGRVCYLEQGSEKNNFSYYAFSSGEYTLIAFASDAFGHSGKTQTVALSGR